MIETYIDHSTLLKYEPRIDDYLGSDQIDYSEQITMAKREIIERLRSYNKKIRLYCTPLTLQASTTKTEAFTGADSNIDYVERLMLVVKVTAITGAAVIQLEGSNSEGTSKTYTEVNLDSEIVPTIIGTYVSRFDDPYSYYRIKVTPGTTITYSAYLVESSFYFAHLYNSLALIFRGLTRREGDNWEQKEKKYSEMYESYFNNMNAYYDEDESGDINPDELIRTSRVRFSR